MFFRHWLDEDARIGKELEDQEYMKIKDGKKRTPFNDIARGCSNIKLSKGFEKADWEDAKAIASKISLIHSELSEALEEVRVDDIHKFHMELADVLIRTLELMIETGADIDLIVKTKMDYNALRPYLHGKKRL